MRSAHLLYMAFAGMSILCSCNKMNGPGTDPAGDSFTVVVHDGYGSGSYRPGDTVHIFSENDTGNQLFDRWTGDVSLLNAQDEWHSWFIMPSKAVTFTAQIKDVPAFTLKFESIRGKSRLKPVYYYFPRQHQGIVYLLHGTDGNAAHLVSDYEWEQLIKRLVDSHFAVIVTEAEEATMHQDNNGDGKIRWALLPNDTLTNVDYANIRVITDTFYHRGLAAPSESRYSIGMSDGGFFSTALSSVYHFKACVNYCAQGSDAAIERTTTPIQFCMARFDSNPQVGEAGNAAAEANASALNARGICSRFLIKERCPLYPQRFARSGILSAGQSEAVFQELKSRGYLDQKNYFVGYADDLVQEYKNNSHRFPVISSLSLSQQLFISAQISLSVSDHKMYSDFDAATVRFLNNPCQ